MDVLQEKEKMMRDYWLNSLGDNQVERLETEWFANDEDAELLEITRADLIDDYVTNNLNTADSTYFEKYFLPNNLDDIILAKTSIEISTGKFVETKKKSIFERISESVRNFASIPQIAFALLFLACVGLFVGYFVRFYNNEPQQIARNNTPEIDTTNKIQNDLNESKVNQNINGSDNNVNSPVVKDSANLKIEPKTGNTKPIKEPTKPADIEVKPANENKMPVETEKPIKQQILFLTTIRGSGKTAVLSNSAENVLLKLEMPGIDKLYKSYEMRIYDSTGRLILKQPITENLSDKKSGEKINLPSLKTTNFKKDTAYKTSLVGIDEKNEVKELCVYDSFKVN
jgi:predicted RND superfamily exporter protein